MPPLNFAPDDPDQLSTIRDLAEQAARAGGKVARAAFHSELSVRRKSDGSEVSDADESAQTEIIACIHAQRPADAFIAEESNEEPRASARAAARSPETPPALPAPSNGHLCWIIDPIDGTRNYIRGVPLYSVSVGVMLGGFPIAGAIYMPETDEMYSVGGPDGASCNDRLLTPTDATEAQNRGRSPKPLVGIPSSLQGLAYGVFHNWIARVVTRNLGSTAMHLALVAAGRFQATLISDSRLWDIAAGWLLVKAAGGLMTTLDGEPIFPLDVAQYTDEPIPSLAACDRQTHAQLLPSDYPPI